MMKKISFILLLLAWGSFSAEAKIKVVDGDSIFIGETEIRLQGIDAPEYYQNCYDANKREYRCGDRAYKALLSLVNEDLYCKKVSEDYYKRTVAICYSAEKDINREMVRQGWAVAYDQYSDIYVEEEKYAKKNKKGIWQGKFMRPEFYRALEKE